MIPANENASNSPLTNGTDAVVAGHLCLDIIPDLQRVSAAQFKALLQPGRMLEVGPAVIATGGPVSNTGLILHRLGIRTHLVGKVGEDLFGKAVCQVIASFDPQLLDGIVVDPLAATSYTIILNPPEVDRIFLHDPGANETFTADDIDVELVARAGLFHFGYPQLLKQMYKAGGDGFVQVMKTAKDAGATTSLDVTFPDPSAETGRADWRSILKKVLPYVDIFLPSIGELLFLLRREVYLEQIDKAGGGAILSQLNPGLLSDLSQELLDMGVKIVVIKLGERGIYLRTAARPDLERLGRAKPVDPASWAGVEFWTPGFRVRVVGTTGAGDSAIAGFLSAFLRGMSPEAALVTAAATGACNVEAADALSGVPKWLQIQERIHSGWPRLPLDLDHSAWTWDSRRLVWVGPRIVLGNP